MNLVVVEGKIVGMPRVFSVSNGAEQVALFRLDADGEDIPISVPLNATNTKADVLEPDVHVLIRGALRYGRFIDAKGQWEVTRGIVASNFDLMDARFEENKEKAKKILGGEKNE